MNVELMLKVKERVLAEPGRVDMQTWAKRVGFAFSWQGYGQYADCGTVCCVAGHALESSGLDVFHELEFSDEDIDVIASQLLDIHQTEGMMLFHFHADDSETSPYLDLQFELLAFVPGTPEYAAVVAKAIDRCIERNAPHHGHGRSRIYYWDRRRRCYRGQAWRESEEVGELVEV